MTEPTTTDMRISWFNAHLQLAVFELPVQCPACNRCLADARGGRCLYGGPFKPQEADVTPQP